MIPAAFTAYTGKDHWQVLLQARAIENTAYVVALIAGWGSTTAQMLIALAAYATYVVNAGQFLLKLRAARRQVPGRAGSSEAGSSEIRSASALEMAR